MNVSVCIRRVPDTETRIRVGDDGVSIDTSGVKYIVSPYDEFALEAGLQVTEGLGVGRVTVVTVGGAGATESLKNSLAMGAHRALLLEGEVTMDGLATAKALAAEFADADAPLILLGVKAADDDQQQVGPMLATLLGRPCATAVKRLEAGDGHVRCHREVEGGTEVVDLPLPCVVTITKGTYEPRYATLKGIMAARRKPLERRPAELPAARLRVLELQPPAPRPPGRIVGEGVDAVPELVRLLREEAGAL